MYLFDIEIAFGFHDTSSLLDYHIYPKEECLDKICFVTTEIISSKTSTKEKKQWKSVGLVFPRVMPPNKEHFLNKWSLIQHTIMRLVNSV